MVRMANVVEIRDIDPLEILSSGRWMSQREIELRASARAALIPILLKTLVERKLAVSRPDDEGDRVYKITIAGVRHVEKTRKHRISLFPLTRFAAAVGT